MSKVIEKLNVLDRKEATQILLAAKKQKGLSYQELSEEIGRDKTWVAAAILGQATMSEEEALTLVKILDVDPTVASVLQQYPMKGSLDSAVPVDPLIYRFHEINQVYGTTFKEVIQEMFGEGIMSAIDFRMDIQKKEDPNGDRVIVTFDGKFLPYKKW
ncbi:cyanase [Priestia flexa]|uniref:Cyanate hydratase n=1 Tax=Priestia veravalensis TaxID=1414648 RepID=A0A0V8JH31_9BACI|nr:MULTISPECIES: cyanase [Priestia]KSU86297.1 cyanate hydratase [Priestia veravalensis]MCG7315559.1 cyanase [Priestia flexa]MCP1189834.1 cyanase [Priestia flexa]MEC0668312.1 cyanase [Priestia flexa]SCC54532.1 cyanate lyase [Priestia flexa]